MSESIFNTDTMTEQHERLGRAYTAWINHEFPDAQTLGDVIIAQRERESLPLFPSVIFPPVSKAARDTAEDVAS